MTTKEFKQLMQTIAEGWNTKNAKQAVDCFTDEAIYIEPPDKQFFKGHEQLYEYFGGDKGFNMKLTWHNLFFDEEKQIGAGEFSFEMNNKNHGVVIVELENGKIKLWREYQWSGDMDYDKFLTTDEKQYKFTFKDLK